MQVRAAIVFLFVFQIIGANYSVADDSWFCTQSSSQRTGDKLFLACGTAIAADESTAREQSLF